MGVLLEGFNRVNISHIRRFSTRNGSFMPKNERSRQHALSL